LGCPSADATRRGDVAEEFTYQAEAKRIPVEIVMPSRCDFPGNGSWNLGMGKPVFGLGTFYTHPSLGDLYYHYFQIRMKEFQSNFLNRCREMNLLVT
jgi:hypothetical protein